MSVSFFFLFCHPPCLCLLYLFLLCSLKICALDLILVGSLYKRIATMFHVRVSPWATETNQFWFGVQCVAVFQPPSHRSHTHFWQHTFQFVWFSWIQLRGILCESAAFGLVCSSFVEDFQAISFSCRSCSVLFCMFVYSCCVRSPFFFFIDFHHFYFALLHRSLNSLSVSLSLPLSLNNKTIRFGISFYRIQIIYVYSNRKWFESIRWSERNKRNEKQSHTMPRFYTVCEEAVNINEVRMIVYQKHTNTIILLEMVTKTWA